jgi:glucokinase
MTSRTAHDGPGEPLAIAIDVGGTGIKAALIDETGRVHHAERRPTGADRGQDAVVATIVQTAVDLNERSDGRATACGVVVPGVVDEAAGIAEWSSNLGIRDVPLRAAVADRIGLPVALGHDVRAGALAEARLGAGRDIRRMFFLGIGTGIAGGFAIDGHIDPGAHGASGEIGHIAVRTGPDARECGCGGRGCLEAYASAASIGRAYGEPGVTAAEVADRARRGDARATEVWLDAVTVLADGLLTGIALYDPELIVLGGGLAEAGAFLLEPLAKALAERRTFHRVPELRRAELGDEAGCRGAALLAFDLGRPR